MQHYNDITIKVYLNIFIEGFTTTIFRFNNEVIKIIIGTFLNNFLKEHNNKYFFRIFQFFFFNCERVY